MKKPCRQPYCKELVTSGYCDKHKSKDIRSFQNKKAHPYYNTSEWRGIAGLRKRHLRRFPFCAECKKQGRFVSATVVDHITPFDRHKDPQVTWALFTDTENLQSLCGHHHAVKTGKGE